MCSGLALICGLVAIIIILLLIVNAPVKSYSYSEDNSNSEALNGATENNSKNSNLTETLKKKVDNLAETVAQQKEFMQFPLLIDYTFSFAEDISYGLDYLVYFREDSPPYKEALEVFESRIKLIESVAQGLTNPQKAQSAKEIESIFQKIKENEKAVQKVRVWSIEKIPPEQWLNRAGVGHMLDACDKALKSAYWEAFVGNFDDASTLIRETEYILGKIKSTLHPNE